MKHNLHLAILLTFLLTFFPQNTSAQEEIVIWIPNIYMSETDLLVDSLASAADEHGVILSAEVYSLSEIYERLPLAIESGIPDLLLLSLNEATSISDFLIEIEDSSIIEKFGLFPQVIDGFRNSNGNITGIGMGIAPVEMLYNPHIFEEYGIEFADQQTPINWDEMLDTATQFEELGFGFTLSPSPYVARTLFANLGEDQFLLYPGASIDTTIAYQADALFLLNVVQVSASPIETLERLVNQETAIVIGDHGLLAIAENLYPEVEIEVAHVPTNTTPVNIGTGFGWFFLNSYRDIEIEVLATASNTIEYVQYTLSTGNVPANYDGFQIWKDELATDFFHVDKIETIESIAQNTTLWQLPVYDAQLGSTDSVVREFVTLLEELADNSPSDVDSPTLERITDWNEEFFEEK